MRIAVAAAAVVFAVLFALTTLVESDEAVQRAAAHFTPDEIARGRAYSFQRRLLFWGREAVHLALLGALALSSPGRRLIAACARTAGDRPTTAFLMVAAACFALERLVLFPFAVAAGWHLQRLWGLTDRGFAPWLWDWAKGTAVTAAVGLILALALHVAMRLWPRRWWAVSAAGAGAFGVVFALILPVVVAPLFNEFTPIGQTRYASMEPSIRRMVARAGVEVGQVLVVDASRQSRHSNAYFTGFGATRRIVLYDNLLAGCEDGAPDAAARRAEVESVVGHEIGHWLHDHIVLGIAAGTVGALVAFYALYRLLARAAASGRFGFSTPHQAAAWPMVLLLTYLATWIALPVENAVSRHFERQADEVGLDLAGNPEAFIEAEKRLVRDNIGNPAPNPVAIWLLATHPPAVERIEAAQRRMGR